MSNNRPKPTVHRHSTCDLCGCDLSNDERVNNGDVCDSCYEPDFDYRLEIEAQLHEQRRKSEFNWMDFGEH